MLNCIVGPILSGRKPPVCRGFISCSGANVNVPRSRSREQVLDTCRRSPGGGRTEELFGDERSRAGAQPRPGPCARTDVEEVADRGAVARLCGKRPPEEVLVDRERSAVRVAALEVAIGGLEVGRREDDAFEDRAFQVRCPLRETCLDPVRVALPQLLRPGAVLGVELAGAVAFYVPRELLELEPEDETALGRARRIDSRRLTHDDRGLGREQPALRFVDRAR